METNSKRRQHDDDAETSSSFPTKRQRTFHNDLDNTTHEPQAASRSHDDYTIAWICALHMELAAARAMLDEPHEDLRRDPNDSNTYTLGSIKDHNIVIACLPAAQYGTNNAANVLTHLVRTFPSIRLGLMVGIGGGVPIMADLRLGDIVVGTRVMQCDLGKIVEDGQIRRTAIPRILQNQLGTLVSTLRSTHEREPSRIPSILREKLEGLTEYSRPSLPDHLFYASYDHASSTPGCDGCDYSRLLPRGRRVSNDPLIHYGAIASGNQVMRSGTARDDIAKQLDVMCFEMEAAGLMDILPCLPIRGICDYSDSHKNKEWQRYAAATAAAYARELLLALPIAQSRANATHMSNPGRLAGSASWPSVQRHQYGDTGNDGIQHQADVHPSHTRDLEDYVESRLRIDDRTLLGELQPQILEKAAGVFLWVVLVIEILNKEYRRGRLALQKRLTEIPSGLSELFKDILRRDNENMEDLLLCILWILYSKRPLQPQEFYHALWSGLSLKGLADSDIPTITGPDASSCVERCVISSSKGLAEITKSKQQPVVQFIHESVRDFLIKDKGLHELWPDLGFDWEIPSHERLKQCCGTYIDNHLARTALENHDEQGDVLEQFPFLDLNDTRLANTPPMQV
ncbi:hypothetical protein G7Z17_g12433 [Cylindrodendrum hubeiense]|uniref:Nucleoside phosphorylase domain-containing protein n=1 Tax=Cylindrodendrum hubeiense TaxID=595255 RepID=A0A9P5L338_9HYPO|nr:hypothetical protein G7Z17_g12433 [Cylindrodendrum hubeiense]